ncbi:hypothetical protein P3W85_27700 [Cupriavidus basilensis]|uniref:Uncharacterized protein n=1 Tax=Cupriavidus basilensis TaxID=68895 RepID=A0ABT6AWV4_9BURK|nr:hypothetical protein [Cupriavidus basilensis]MDF3836712.1 hypothetical protein [Cupriavidus basilensis]
MEDKQRLRWSEYLKFEVDRGIPTIPLNDAEKLNVFAEDMLETSIAAL